MVRIALSLYLMASAAAGPLCCCTVQRVAALFAHPAKDASEAHGGCCGQKQPASGHQKHHTPERQRGEPDQPARPSCPCQGEGSQPVSVASLDSESVQQLQLRYSSEVSLLFPSVTPMLPGLTAAGAGQACAEGVTLPFLSAQDILYTLHMLRC